MKNCCAKTSKKTKQCIRKDGKVFELPRRFTRDRCIKGPVRGFTMRSSCSPYKFCKSKSVKMSGGGRSKKYKLAYFSGGCFWSMQSKFSKLVGVLDTFVGYMGGSIKNPTYELVSSGKTDYAETLKIRYNPKLIDFEGLVKYFFTIHDSTTLNRQGNDVGRQYRSIVFYSNNKEKNIFLKVIRGLSYSDKITTQFLPTSKYNFHQA